MAEGFDRTVLNAVGKAIESRIRNDTEACLRTQLLGSTETSNKLRRILASCMGKKMCVQISIGTLKALEDESAFGRTLYRTIISKTSSAIFKTLKKDRKATGWGALGKLLLS